MEKRRVLLPLEACQPSSPRSSDAILNGFGTSFIDDYEALFGAIALVVIRLPKGFPIRSLYNSAFKILYATVGVARPRLALCLVPWIPGQQTMRGSLFALLNLPNL